MKTFSSLKSAAERAYAAANSEVRVMHPGGQVAEPTFEDWLRWITLTPKSGVLIKMICSHKIRADMAVRPHVSALAEAGVEIRTTTTVGLRLIIIDSVRAYISSPVDEHSAIEIHDPTLLSAMEQVFVEVWDRSTPGVSRGSHEAPASQTELAIARLLVAGYLDEAIARRIGLSVRACRAHIAKLSKRLGTTSRAQLGYQIAESGILNQPEPI
ncbi:helix-turn-helix transcriptional regulator [Phytoactinopolyspora limicola]|uniref:helix-turn-helix transcriptional regulator n=1 Tax=Phytoactinopolyspora limicola TaxID=2715536 RepID=UPI0014094BFF|nr:helix-turn-helix transcriptional regulator [Phytoactinopolyspora limicola]